MKLEKVPLNMLGYLILLKMKEKKGSQLIAHFGNLKLINILALLLMLQDIEISLKT